MNIEWQDALAAAGSCDRRRRSDRHQPRPDQQADRHAHAGSCVSRRGGRGVSRRSSSALNTIIPTRSAGCRARSRGSWPASASSALGVILRDGQKQEVIGLDDGGHRLGSRQRWASGARARRVGGGGDDHRARRCTVRARVGLHQADTWLARRRGRRTRSPAIPASPHPGEGRATRRLEGRGRHAKSVASLRDARVRQSFGGLSRMRTEFTSPAETPRTAPAPPRSSPQLGAPPFLSHVHFCISSLPLLAVGLQIERPQRSPRRPAPAARNSRKRAFPSARRPRSGARNRR